MPKMGESIAEATVLKWLKGPGDTVEVDEPILEIATDKVDSEVPSPVNGTIVDTFFSEDDVVEVGKAVATISTDDEVPADVPVVEDDGSSAAQAEAPASSSGSATTTETATATATATAPAAMATQAAPAETPASEGSRFYSPLVMNIAREEGIGMDELERMEGTGRDGRVTKKDILAYVKQRTEAPKAAPQAQPQPQPQAAPAPTNGRQAAQPQAAPEPKAPPVQPMEGDEIEEMDRMRKLIADHMVTSKRISPHVTSMVEVDMTNMVHWRNKIKKQFEEREGEKLTFTPLFIEAVVKALKDFPRVNVSLNGNQIIKRKRINIGMATALPSGNLIVPVIPDADQLNLIGLAKKVNDLAKRARDNKLKPGETDGGTFTITNVGTFGNVMGTPVINQPQVAILATGAIKKKPAVLETPHGDVIAIRHMMYLSLSYDHRIVDGALGGGFVRRIGDYLEQFDPERTL